MILHELIDYETLRLIWWVLLGVLLIAFAVTDGFDMGVGTLLPFVARSDVERRVVINTIGPVWEGNQVWLVLGGGAIFAAWPPLYAVSFSGFYLAMFIVLAALILRPVGFKYRSKRDSAKWRTMWDWALFIGGAVPALIFGVAVGNVLQGVPFRLTDELMPIYDGTLFGLLNPYALLCGVLSVCMLVMHGGAWLGLKADGVVADRARLYGAFGAVGVIVLFAVNGVLLALFVDGYRFTSEVDPLGPSNPLFSEVTREGASWLDNYADNPWMLIAPALGFLGALGALIGLRRGVEGLTFLSSKLSVVGVISTVGLSMFPFILPSSIDPRSSLTVWDSSSSHQTLFIMLMCVVIFLPLVLAYTAWVYKVLWGKVTEDSVREHSDQVY
ncbi:MAG: cytochrome d ubiquinol oxidase subunit II [Rhodospirillaceae bacterium]|nr:cytochrome d ubiquinol oxidase subunit II [Rhodospirillaceae bacterium]